MSLRPAQENRRLALTRDGSNLGILLRERYKFLGAYVNSGDRVLEIGAGIGITTRYLPAVNLICTDVEANPWIDALADGQALPFPDASFDAVVCIAALHHMRHPLLALREMARVLKPSGKALIMEVHASLLLRMLLKITGHEYVDRNVDPFGPNSCQSRQGGNWDGNNAIGDLLFADRKRIAEALPSLKIIHHRYTESFLFVNSGGVNYKTPHIPLPTIVLELVVALDRWLGKMAPDVFSICQEIVLEREQAGFTPSPRS
ncbi:MAG: class I SAM-dependent methyltransferase [Alphaproteobacteria bacterium]|nr:class I SAM-dependent methyltransferase [Alphaproteobacteria bacterium]